MTVTRRGIVKLAVAGFILGRGSRAEAADDFENMARQFPAYDALYAYCGAARRPR